MDYEKIELLDNNSRFILGYLKISKQKQALFDQDVLDHNNIDQPLFRFIEDAIILNMDEYVKIIKKGDGYIYLQLTNSGYSLLNIIKIDNEIKLMTLRRRLFLFIRSSLSRVKMIMKSETTSKRILFVCTVIIALWAFIQLLYWGHGFIIRFLTDLQRFSTDSSN